MAFVTTLPTNIFPPGGEYGNIVAFDRQTSQYWQPRPLPRLYVSSDADQSVHAFNIIDKGHLAEIASVGVGVGASALTVTSTPQLFVANTAAGTLSTVNTWGMYSLPGEDVVLGPAGTAMPSAIAVDTVIPRVYVTDAGQHKLVFVNPKLVGSPLAVEGTVDVGSAPSAVELCISKTVCGTKDDRRKIFVANKDSNDLSVVDPGLGAVTATIPVGTEPVALQLTPARLYVANRGSNTVSVLAPAATGGNYSVSDTVNVGTAPVDLAYVDLGGGRQRVFTANSGRATSPYSPILHLRLPPR